MRDPPSAPRPGRGESVSWVLAQRAEQSFPGWEGTGLTGTGPAFSDRAHHTVARSAGQGLNPPATINDRLTLAAG